MNPSSRTEILANELFGTCPDGMYDYLILNDDNVPIIIRHDTAGFVWWIAEYDGEKWQVKKEEEEDITQKVHSLES